MTIETLAEIGPELSVPRFRVEIGSLAVEETDGLFSSVRVDRRIDGADRFSLSVATRYDHEDGAFVDFDWEDVPVGAPVEIALGYGPELDPVLTGMVTEHETDFPAGGAPSITISGYGRYHALTKHVVTEQYDEQTDSEIAASIADAYGLRADVDPTGGGEEPVEQEYDSDAAFLEDKLAPRNEAGTGPFEVFARLDELVFRAPRDDAEPQLTLSYGESLQSFSPTLTEAETHERIEVRHWDQRRKADILGVAEHEDGTGTRTIRMPVASDEAAAAVAEAVLRRELHQRLTGNGTTVGLPQLTIGEPIHLTGLGDRFSGIYYVESVTHSIDGGGYTTDFEVRAALTGAFA